MWKCAICRIPLLCRLQTFTANYVHPSGPLCLVRLQLQCSFVLGVISINCRNVRYSYRGNNIPYFQRKAVNKCFLKLYSNTYFSNFTTFRVRSDIKVFLRDKNVCKCFVTSLPRYTMHLFYKYKNKYMYRNLPWWLETLYDLLTTNIKNNNIPQIGINKDKIAETMCIHFDHKSLPQQI